MKEILAIINQKGGVGKSTTAAAIGAGLILKGHKVLYIDLDAQGNLTFNMGIGAAAISSLEVLTGTAPAREAIRRTASGDIIPASPALAGADSIITATGKEYRLKEALEPLHSLYDYIVIDTPPALGILTVNALTACTGAIIPAQADAYSLQGIAMLGQTVDTVRKYCNRALTIKGIVLTRYNSRAVLSRDMAELISQTATQLHTKLYTSTIRECTALKEAQAVQQDIFTYAPRSNAATDYKALVAEILEEA
jgi:chromosome partitioning protein